MKDNPCLNCKIRHVGCHSDCEIEEAWQEENRDRKEKAKASKDDEMMLDDFRRRGVRKAYRRRRK